MPMWVAGLALLAAGGASAGANYLLGRPIPDVTWFAIAVAVGIEGTCFDYWLQRKTAEMRERGRQAD